MIDHGAGKSEDARTRCEMGRWTATFDRRWFVSDERDDSSIIGFRRKYLLESAICS